jgi:Ca2+-binding RTX toxin-like protein
LQNVSTGRGNDVVNSHTNGERQVIRLGAGNDTANFSGNDNLYNVHGNSGHDVINAGGDHNKAIITGGRGNDVATVTGSNNVVNFHGGSGHDTANIGGLCNKVITTSTETVNVSGHNNRIDVVNGGQINLSADATGNYIVTKGHKQPVIPPTFRQVAHNQFVDTRNNTIVRDAHGRAIC